MCHIYIIYCLYKIVHLFIFPKHRHVIPTDVHALLIKCIVLVTTQLISIKCYICSFAFRVSAQLKVLDVIYMLCCGTHIMYVINGILHYSVKFRLYIDVYQCFLSLVSKGYGVCHMERDC